MIQKNSYLSVIDNSGAKKVACINIYLGYKKRYAHIGEVILVSVKSLRSKRRKTSKVKKGEVIKALILRTKINNSLYSGDTFTFFENSVLILNKKNKILGTRLFGVIPKLFRQTRFLKICSVSLGIVM
jgi:large subunit ribosomal protein L14